MSVYEEIPKVTYLEVLDSIHATQATSTAHGVFPGISLLSLMHSVYTHGTVGVSRPSE
jgi:hypothetical protein